MQLTLGRMAGAWLGVTDQDAPSSGGEMLGITSWYSPSCEVEPLGIWLSITDWDTASSGRATGNV